MSDISWIKIVTDIFDNRKIKQIEKLPDGDSMIVIWIKLLCLAGTTNDNGYVYLTKEIPYTDQMLSAQFNRPLTTIQAAMKLFETFGMIESDRNGTISVANWEKYQNVVGMELVREQARVRAQKHRDKVKAIEAVTLRVTLRNGEVTQQNKNKINNTKKESIKEKSRFAAPTLTEVQTYCVERNNNINAEQFIDFYESKGWMIGKNHMKDWHAAIRTWERKEQKNGRAKSEAIIPQKYTII